MGFNEHYMRKGNRRRRIEEVGLLFCSFGEKMNSNQVDENPLAIMS